ncbi:predicted protein [Coccidioides posadasii str. Silveira]|uniref:Predicted protein n=1 Tax=Coccidioides posadasii (strain RMSCC 757 / Silveira) TaxID=443226 RepID=E9DFH5_COCPS|nr:predicted protein [Coccidioides posadasii str. Silveira]
MELDQNLTNQPNDVSLPPGEGECAYPPGGSETHTLARAAVERADWNLEVGKKQCRWRRRYSQDQGTGKSPSTLPALWQAFQEDQVRSNTPTSHTSGFDTPLCFSATHPAKSRCHVSYTQQGCKNGSSASDQGMMVRLGTDQDFFAQESPCGGAVLRHGQPALPLCGVAKMILSDFTPALELRSAQLVAWPPGFRKWNTRYIANGKTVRDSMQRWSAKA